jgi:hypothetical protein
MLASDRQRGRRVLFRVLLAYALVATAAAMPGVRQAWDEIFGPNDAQLVIVSEALIRNVRVTYDGREIGSRPDWPIEELIGYAAYPAMRTRLFEPLLTVTWEGPNGARSVSRVMRQSDSGRVCLYVLSIDSDGDPAAREPSGSMAPFWRTCYSR